MMKLAKELSICLAVVIGFSSSLQGETQVNLEDPQVIKQQAEDAITFAAMIDPWKSAIEKYSEKNNIDLQIKCKNCGERVLTLGEFDCSLMVWLINGIAGGHGAFEKVKALEEEYIKLFLNSASSEEVINFMLKTSNDMKEFCMGCHGAEWEKVK
jgi:hypothetical protein